MTDGTSLNDLPTHSVENQTMPVQMPTQESAPKIAPAPAQGQVTVSRDNNDQVIGELIRGLQEASLTGATQLPYRDVPQSTEALMTDPHIQQPHYIQQPQRNIMPKNMTETPSQQRDGGNNKIDDLYNEIQIPLLLAILYFLFQLPILRKYALKYLQFMFMKDGNANLYYFIFTSVLFGLCYYVSVKLFS